MPPKQPPLPVASNHAAISNRISMLLSSQSSLLKTLNPSSSSSSSSKRPASKHSTIHDQEKDDEDLFKNNARPNEGVGYTAPSSSGTQSAHDRRKEDQALRGRMMGKGGRQTAATDGKGRRGNGRSLMMNKEESESEEEMGRSALGKRKRAAARESPVKTEVDGESGEQGAEVGEEAKEAEEGSDQNQGNDETGQDEGVANETATQKKRKKNKKKSKSKNKNKQRTAEAS